MKIKLMPRVEDILTEEIEGSSVIVIDMLRATSVITTALGSGAQKVIPVLTIQEALEIRKKYPCNTVLGGERNGIKIEGFDGGNSPLEYTRDFIEGKIFIITTSNGTKAIYGCSGARNIFIGSMLNGTATAKKAAAQEAALDEDVCIVCAGTLGRFSLEDFVCAGYIIDELLKLKNYELNDISFLAYHTFANNRDDIEGFLKNSSHYDYLVSIGAADDIKFCCQMSISDIVPVFKNGLIIAAE